jgi:hypothetical protein
MYDDGSGGEDLLTSDPEMERRKRLLEQEQADNQYQSQHVSGGAGNHPVHPSDPSMDKVMARILGGGDEPAPDPKPTSATPPVPQPPMPPDPGKAARFDAQSPQAEEYEGIVNQFKTDRMNGEGGAGTYKAPDGMVRNMPQVYGQDGSPADPNEGPNTPEVTAEKLAKLNSVPGAALLDRKKHTLGYGLNFGTKNEARKKHYADYVANSQAQRNQQRAAQQERATANRADIADRNARTMQQLGDYNAVQGGGRMGGYDGDGPSVSRVGGVTLLRGLGRYRPMDAMENADLESKKADAAWKRSRPADAAEDNMRQLTELQRKMKEDTEKNNRFTRSLESREKFQAEGMALRKKAQEAAATGREAELAQDAGRVAKRMEQIAQVLKVKMAEGKRKGGWLGSDGSKDAWVDPTDMSVDASRPVSGDFDKWKGMLDAEMDTYKIVSRNGELPDTVMAVIQEMAGGG